jgi:hypothetical protein
MPGFLEFFFFNLYIPSIVPKQRVGVSGCSSIGVTLRRSQVSSRKALVHYRLIFVFDLSGERELRRHISTSDGPVVFSPFMSVMASRLHFRDLNLYLTTYI